jgi:hypothetical protein
MAYVVARRGGRFEIRESEHTTKGPRARTLASFRVLSETVLAAAASKARRAFDVQSVLASGRRAGAPVESPAIASGASLATLGETPSRYDAFLASTRRMARATSRPQSKRMRSDPGTALMELLGFADAVTLSQPARPAAPLRFPVLARLARNNARAGKDPRGMQQVPASHRL